MCERERAGQYELRGVLVQTLRLSRGFGSGTCASSELQGKCALTQGEAVDPRRLQHRRAYRPSPCIGGFCTSRPGRKEPLRCATYSYNESIKNAILEQHGWGKGRSELGGETPAQGDASDPLKAGKMNVKKERGHSLCPHSWPL